MTRTRTRTAWAASIVAAVALAGCSSPPRAQPVPATGSSSGAAHMVDRDQLARQLDVFLANDARTTDTFRNRRALLISVDGRPVVERYWRSSATTSGDVGSITKTVIGILIGIALGEGQLHGLDQTLGQLLPAYASVMNRQVAAITLRQLLTMTSGLPADDDPYIRKVLATKQDWVGAILAHGITGQPGSFQHSSAGSHLLSVILSEATGRRVLDYARQKLFDPLGISTRPAAEPIALPEKKNIDIYTRAGFAWATDPQGHHFGAGGMKLTARDMVKVGQLWLQNGQWDDKQLAPAQWIKAARTAQVPTGDSAAEAYGYQIWLGASAGHDALMAWGLGGQLMEIVPDLGLVVAVLSDLPLGQQPAPGTANSDAWVGIVANFIAPNVH